MDSANKFETSGTRVQRHGFVADIMVCHSAAGDAYQYIIVREGGRQIMCGGKEASMMQALERVYEFLGRYEQRKVSGF